MILKIKNKLGERLTSRRTLGATFAKHSESFTN